DRLEQVDGDDHVEVLAAVCARLLELQRADAEEIALWSDERGAAPVRMCRRREDRLVEQVFPVAGEFLAGSDAGSDRVVASAGAGNYDRLAHHGLPRLPERQCGHVEAIQPLQQAAPTLPVVAKHMAGSDPTGGEGDPHLPGLGDQIADGEQDAVLAVENAATGT